MDQGNEGTRVVWVRLAGPVYNLFVIVVYIPHKGRKNVPFAQDTIEEIKKLDGFSKKYKKFSIIVIVFV